MDIRYSFHGVGQGLFCSGEVDGFHWVYDCGSFNEDILKNAIEEYDYDSIDLLVISHFHKDHINGIQLLEKKNKPIKAVLIPYLTNKERACILIDWIYDKSIDITEDFLRLIHSPAQYFKNSKIIYFYSSNTTQRPDGVFDLEKKYSRKYIAHSSDDLWKTRSKDIKNIYDLTSEKLKYKDYFFIPYYETSRLSSAAKELTNCKEIKKIEDFFSQSISPKKLKNVFQMIEEIRKKRKNTVPYAEKYSMCLLGSPKRINDRLEKDSDQDYVRKYLNRRKSGVLYTGDAPLKANYRVDKLMKYYKNYLKNILCFQVMHHGSKYNFAKNGNVLKKGDSPKKIADLICPCFSIFSANPKENFHHPHQETLEMFSDYGPLLVNRNKFEFSPPNGQIKVAIGRWGEDDI